MIAPRGNKMTKESPMRTPCAIIILSRCVKPIFKTGVTPPVIVGMRFDEPDEVCVGLDVVVLELPEFEGVTCADFISI